MQPISVVIMCRNELANIKATIAAAQKLTNSITVVDTGSSDGTVELLKRMQVSLIQNEWLGFGPTKNVGIAAATHNWILSLDADEVIDTTLINAINKLKLENQNKAYKIKFLHYVDKTPLHFGEWKGDNHIRLFNRNNVTWNDAAVHETLIFKTTPVIITLDGHIHHKTVKDVTEMRTKMDYYANLSAKKYLQLGKKNATLMKYISPFFSFLKNYIFKLGFLDGKVGWQVARENFIYTYKKYYYLQKFQQ